MDTKLEPGNVALWRGNSNSMRPDQPVVLLESIVEGRTWVILLENGDVVTAIAEELEVIKESRKRRGISSGDWLVWRTGPVDDGQEQLVMLISPLENDRKWETETEDGKRFVIRVEDLFNVDEDGELHVALLGGELTCP